jgi:hypothetical protein
VLDVQVNFYIYRYNNIIYYFFIGTIVALELCMRTLAAGCELSVYNVVKELRQRRFLACQTPHQYLYIHRALLQYITSKNIISSEEAQKWAIEYESIIKTGAAAQ